MSPRSTVIGKLDDGKIVRDDGIFESADFPEDGELIQRNKNSGSGRSRSSGCHCNEYEWRQWRSVIYFAKLFPMNSI